MSLFTVGCVFMRAPPIAEFNEKEDLRNTEATEERGGHALQAISIDSLYIVTIYKYCYVK